MTKLLARAIDISSAVHPGMVAYPGECQTEQHVHLRAGEENPVTCTHWSMTAHAGAHLDAPAHFDARGKQIADFSIHDFEFSCAVLDATTLRSQGRHVDPAFLQEHSTVWKGAEAILFKTHHGELWTSSAFDPSHTAIAPDAAEVIATHAPGIRLVGIDYFSVEPFGSDPARTHLALLRRGLFILEGIDLSMISGSGPFTLLALPVKWLNAEAAPCRAVLIP